MRRGAAAALVAALLLCAATGAAAQPVWRPHVSTAVRFAKQRRGQIAIAVSTRERFWGWHDRRTYPSASVIKAMLLTAYLDRGSVRHRRLHHWERAVLEPMIRRSDNEAASRIMRIVGTGGLRKLARRAGMRRFTPVAGYWGTSRIDARDQARYFLRIDRFMPRRHRSYGMRLLKSVVPEQRWGVAQVQPPHWNLFFKGGWGSGSGAVDHQVALLKRGHRRVAIAVLTYANGSHEYGRRTLRGVFGRLLRGLNDSPVR